MNRRSRDISVLRNILRYCGELDLINREFRFSLPAMRESAIYRNAAAMCILQIGEQTKYLSQEIKNKHSGMPWESIRHFRNFLAHQYAELDSETLWDTAVDDIPKLRKYCEKIIMII